MAKHVFLLDITRHGGPVQTMVGSARALFSSFQPAVVEWISLADQSVHPLAGEEVGVVPSPASARAYIENRINLLSVADEYTFHVFSYDSAVLNRAGVLNTPSRVVCPVHLVMLDQEHKGPPRPFTASQIITRNESTIGAHPGALKSSEAAELAKRVLSKHGHVSKETALKQTRLRKLMSDEDPRAEKRLGDPQSVKLITYLVSAGLRDGWLEQGTIDGKSGTEVLWLRSAKPLPESLPSLSAPATSVAGVPVVATQVTTDKGQRRTDQIIQCLKDAGIYAAKDIRDYIFKAAHAKVASSTPALSLAQLKRKTLVAAEEAAVSAGVSFKFWYVATESVFKLMLLAAVLVDENNLTVMLGARARLAKVTAIRPDFVSTCELFLLQYVLNKLQDITERDCTALAHALFKEAPSKTTRDKMLDQVDQLFEKLGDRLLEDDDGALSVVLDHEAVAVSLT
jgi:hypothetical protein